MAPEGSKVASPIRVLVADKSAPYREELRKLIQAKDGFALMGEVSDGEALLAMAREGRPHLILFGLPTSRKEGLNFLQEISAAEMPLRTLLLADFINPPEAMQALRLGASGVILKESTTQFLFDGIRCVLQGRYWVTGRCMPDLMRALRGLSTPSNGLAFSDELGLTLRELEIVKLVVAGYSNADIAQNCSTSEQAIRRHLRNIFDKLDVANKVELALFAANHQLLIPSK